MGPRARTALVEIPVLAGITYLFFLSISLMGTGMKASFKESVQGYLTTHASDFTELVSFVIGVLVTSVVQSSSTVTSMTVVMASEGIVPLAIAIGIVHGANLGTSVTSSLVAFAAETRPMTGRPLTDLRNLMFAKRLPGFHRAVGTAVVHGMFNAMLITFIVVAIEIPFGGIHRLATWLAGAMTESAASSAAWVEAAEVLTPGAWTDPLAKGAVKAGVPGWALVIAGFALLFVCLKLFSSRMRNILLADVDPNDVEALGRKLLGRHPLDTFARGLGLTMLVQSSSATTSLVVPLAGMGFFTVKQIFPFIMGANIGTTLTATMAATAAFGEPGFQTGMTIALCHVLVNTLAVVLVAVVPGAYTSVTGAAEWLADVSERSPVALLGYLGAMSLALPAVVYFLPTAVSYGVLVGALALMFVGPHVYLRRKAARPALGSETALAS